MTRLFQRTESMRVRVSLPAPWVSDEMVAMSDLKSDAPKERVGSTPTSPTVLDLVEIW